MKEFPRILQFHKETQNKITLPQDPADWPKEWRTIEYKQYPRFEQFPLPQAQETERSFFNVLRKRRSFRQFESDTPLKTQELANFLYFSAGLKNPEDLVSENNRFYPSGGGRFTLEVYIAFQGNEDIPKGVYHYNVATHSLEKLLDARGCDDLYGLLGYAFAKKSQATFFITGVFNRAMMKYKERGYRFGIIECGVMVHNMYLAGEALSLGTCALGVSIDLPVEKILDLDSNREGLLTCLVMGPTQKNSS